MKIKVTINPYPYINNLITKIIYLMRMISISTGDVVLIRGSNKVKFVVFTSCLLASRTLFLIKDEKEINELKFIENIGTILHTDTYKDLKELMVLASDLTATIFEEDLFSTTIDFHFLMIYQWSEDNWETYDLIQDSSFKDERDTMNRMFKYRFKKGYNSAVFVNTVDNKEYRYESNNIQHMLNAVDSEFKDKPPAAVRFDKLPFEKGFIYMLYFFLRGDVVDIGNPSIVANTLLNSDRRLKEVVIVDNDTFEQHFHKQLKYNIYSRWNLFFNKWWITRWLTKFTYDYAIRKQLTSRNNYELIILNKERSLDKSQFLDQARTYISIIYGTPADGYTLGINRYTDKELSIVDHSFRVMDYDNTIKVQVDTLNRLCIAGIRIPNNVKNMYAIQSKSNTDLYHLCDTYCSLKGEILTIKADLSDIYYDLKGNIAVDIGTRKRSLMAIPYLKRVDVFKVLDKVVTIVQMDEDFINKKFEVRTFHYVLHHLRGKIQELNNDFDKSEQIQEVIVSQKFFDEVDRVKHTTTKEDFIELLNQQPFNYLEKFLNAETFV